MFHSRDGLFFNRVGSGEVHVIVTKGKFPSEAPEEVVFDVILDEGTWASVFASMSRGGETGDSFRKALAFHQGGADRQGTDPAIVAAMEEIKELINETMGKQEPDGLNMIGVALQGNSLDEMHYQMHVSKRRLRLIRYALQVVINGFSH